MSVPSGEERGGNFFTSKNVSGSLGVTGGEGEKKKSSKEKVVTTQPAKGEKGLRIFSLT